MVHTKTTGALSSQYSITTIGGYKWNGLPGNSVSDMEVGIIVGVHGIIVRWLSLAKPHDDGNFRGASLRYGNRG